jgi:hypothetical protein
LLYLHWSSLRITLLAALYFGLFVFAGEVAERQVYNSNVSWQNYKDFESARYQIQDNLIERNLSSNPINYGWTQAEYLIFDDYLYADPTVFTTDKLKQATKSELNATSVEASSLFRDFQENSRNPLSPWTGVIAALIFFLNPNISFLFLYFHNVETSRKSSNINSLSDFHGNSYNDSFRKQRLKR